MPTRVKVLYSLAWHAIEGFIFGEERKDCTYPPEGSWTSGRLRSLEIASSGQLLLTIFLLGFLNV